MAQGVRKPVSEFTQGGGRGSVWFATATEPSIPTADHHMTANSDPSGENDISHKEHTHEELLRFRAAIDMCGDAIYLVERASMRFVDVNQTACDRVG